jgi:hypothetical protein
MCLPNTFLQRQIEFSLISSVFTVFAPLSLACELNFAAALPMFAIQRMFAIESASAV